MHDYLHMLSMRIDRFKKQQKERQPWGIISIDYDMETSEIDGKIVALETVRRELCHIL